MKLSKLARRFPAAVSPVGSGFYGSRWISIRVGCGHGLRPGREFVS